MKVYIVVSVYETSFDYEEIFTTDIEAVFTNKRDAARYIIAHRDEPEHLRIEEYSVDTDSYMGFGIPQKIVMGKYYPKSNHLVRDKVIYDYFFCEEIIEKEDVVLLSTTVPIEVSDSEAFTILEDKYKRWANRRNNHDEEV